MSDSVKNHPVRAELSHEDGEMEGQLFAILFNAPKKEGGGIFNPVQNARFRTDTFFRT